MGSGDCSRFRAPGSSHLTPVKSDATAVAAVNHDEEEAAFA